MDRWPNDINNFKHTESQMLDIAYGMKSVNCLYWVNVTTVLSGIDIVIPVFLTDHKKLLLPGLK